MHLFSKLKICSIQILLTGFISTTKIKNISKCHCVTEHSMHVCFLISKIWNNCINQMHTLRLQNPWQQVNNLILILFLYLWPHLALVKNQVANNLLFYSRCFFYFFDAGTFLVHLVYAKMSLCNHELSVICRCYFWYHHCWWLSLCMGCSGSYNCSLEVETSNFQDA